MKDTAMNLTLIHTALLVMEVISFVIVAPKFKKKLFVYYTMLSNICAGIASASFLLLGGASVVTMALRYNATCMLTLTFLVANLVLIPMDMGVRGILWEDCGLVFHLIAPVLSCVSYECFETHMPKTGIGIPLSVTVIYAIVILTLIGLDKIKPPYPFMEIRKQSLFVSVMWACLILGVVALISFFI